MLLRFEVGEMFEVFEALHLKCIFFDLSYNYKSIAKQKMALNNIFKDIEIVCLTSLLFIIKGF